MLQQRDDHLNTNRPFYHQSFKESHLFYTILGSFTRTTDWRHLSSRQNNLFSLMNLKLHTLVDHYHLKFFRTIELTWPEIYHSKFAMKLWNLQNLAKFFGFQVFDYSNFDFLPKLQFLRYWLLTRPKTQLWLYKQLILSITITSTQP